MSAFQCVTYQKLCNGVANQSNLVELMKNAVELERKESALYRAAMAAADLAHKAAIAEKASTMAALAVGAGNPILMAAANAAGEALEWASTRLEKATADADIAAKSLREAESNLAGSERELSIRILERDGHPLSCTICVRERQSNKGHKEDSTKWIVATLQSGEPTNIQYRIITAYEDSEFYAYALAIHNGYDRPVEFDYKVYFSTSAPDTFAQYLYTNKTLDWIGFGHSEPVRIEIVRLVYR